MGHRGRVNENVPSVLSLFCHTCLLCFVIHVSYVLSYMSPLLCHTCLLCYVIHVSSVWGTERALVGLYVYVCVLVSVWMCR